MALDTGIGGRAGDRSRMTGGESSSLLRPVASRNTYEWLKYQDEPHYEYGTEHSMNTIDSIGRWTSSLWSDAASHVSHGSSHGGVSQGYGTIDGNSGHLTASADDSGAHNRQQRLKIEYSVFQPSIKSGPIPKPLDTKPHFDTVVEDCMVAIEVQHIELQRINAGSSGSYFVFGTENSKEPNGVFKPKDEEPYGPFSPKWTKWLHRTFFPCFFGRSCLIPNLGYVCEAAASLLDSRLRIGLVPHTEVLSLSSTRFYDYRNHWFCGFKPRLQNKIGSFQLFVHEYMSADEFLSKYPLPTMFRDHFSTHGNQNPEGFHWNNYTLKQFRLQLEKLIILDYIMRNTDRGLDNWMVKVYQNESNGKWEVKLAAIDNGLAFPWKHPDEWRSFPYGWLFLPLSILNVPFSNQTREHFLPILLHTKWWEETYREFTSLFAMDSEFKASLWKKQWSVLKGQAFNVVETLKDPRCGPLELVKRTPCLVVDGLMEYTFYPTQETTLSHSLAESLPKQSSPMIVGSIPNLIDEHKLSQPNNQDNDNSNSNSNLNPIEERTPTHPQKKTVIIERLQICNSKQPLFTWW